MTAIKQQFLRSIAFQRATVPDENVYPFSLPIVRALDRIELHPHVTFLVGENGSGKSTLLEAIAVAWGFNPEGGSRNFRFATRASHTDLHRYILDEPEAALSPSRQLAMLVRLHELVNSGSQFLIATHSPIVLAYPKARILSLDGGELVETVYEETEHFQLTRRFLNDHRAMLGRLLEDGEDTSD